MSHVACSPACAQEVAKAKAVKAEKASDAVRKEALKSRSDHLREAQAAFNAYIRARDINQPCISCQRHHQGAHDAGHFKSVGAHPELRFNEFNVHKQCVPCNMNLSGNVHNYRANLVRIFGADRVEELEQQQPAAKYTIEDAKAIKAKYRAKLKQLLLETK